MRQNGKYEVKTDGQYHIIGGLRLLVQKWAASEAVKEGQKGVWQIHNTYSRDTKLTGPQIGLATVPQSAKRVRRESTIEYPSAGKKNWI
jgi:hypothetical protein